MSELSDAIELTTDHTTPEEEKKILQGIVKFGDIEVKEIMRARLDVAAVESNTAYSEMMEFVMDAGYSRIPVYEETFDKVKGILYIKDLLPYLKEKDSFKWQKLLRDAFFVPENKKISDLLQEFQEKKIHLAVVVDEYGGTSGIITLEDIIEEIVGEISDEQDEPLDEVAYSRIDQNKYIFEGKISINDFCKIVGVDDDIFDQVKGDADSLAGLLLELMEKMPDKEESVEYKYFRFIVKAVDKRRIKRVQVEISDTELNDREEGL
jgi:gliding motility-associated protein GldE